MVKVGDIIDGRRVTRVYMLVGEVAYDTEPVEDIRIEDIKAEEPVEKPKRTRRKKEQ